MDATRTFANSSTSARLEVVAGWLVWAYFLLIFTKVFEVAAFKLGSPIRPTMVYGIVASASTICALSCLRGHALSGSLLEKLFFGVFAALSVLILLQYRGESLGPDFGLKLIVPTEMPSAISYAVWPMLNLAMAFSLYVFARVLGLWRTILAAAAVAFAVQIITMEADLIWPAIFGQANGRAAGFARNANIAALFLGVILALHLPLTFGHPLTKRAISYFLVALPAFIAANSRMGWIILIVLAACAAATQIRSAQRLCFPGKRFFAVYACIIAGTLMLSPNYLGLLHVPAPPGYEALASVIRGTPGTMSRTLTTFDPGQDESFAERAKALKNFSTLILNEPIIGGLGTGFANKFEVGPHNMWLKLWVENGVAGALLFTSMIGLMALISIDRRSPALIAGTLISVLSSLLSHTSLVEPVLFVTFAAVLGATSASSFSSEKGWIRMAAQYAALFVIYVYATSGLIDAIVEPDATVKPVIAVLIGWIVVFLIAAPLLLYGLRRSVRRV